MTRVRLSKSRHREQQMEDDLPIPASLQPGQPKDESFLATKFHWSRNDRPKWLLALLAGCMSIYMTRIIMPLCVVSLAEELHWDKRQSVSCILVIIFLFMLLLLFVLTSNCISDR